MACSFRVSFTAMLIRSSLDRVYKSLSYYDKVICNFAEMEGYYGKKTWSVFESHSRNTFCERNVCGRRRRFDCTKTKLRESIKRNERYQVAEKVGL